jgi:DnaK suppressor protein
MAKKKNAASNGLTPETLEELRVALLQEREQLVRQIKSLSSASLTSTRQAGEELADVGSDDFIRETELALMSEEGDRLALINNALEELGTGAYGICMDCDNPISAGRLKAKPYAKLCIECKSAREMNGGMPPQSASPRRGR